MMILRSVSAYDPDKDAWKVITIIMKSHKSFHMLKFILFKFSI